MLQLPITIRVPGPDEMPDRPDLPELLEKRRRAKIVPGFKMKKNTTPLLPYEFIADINVNNPDLWKLFLELARLMPDETCVEYGCYGEEPVTTHYFKTGMILQRLSVFKTEFSQDGFLSCSLRSHAKGKLDEISISECKYIQFWSSNKEGFLEVMKKFGLKEVTDLAFIDEYPKIIDSLSRYLPPSRPPEEVIFQMNRFFNMETDLL